MNLDLGKSISSATKIDSGSVLYNDGPLNILALDWQAGGDGHTEIEISFGNRFQVRLHEQDTLELCEKLKDSIEAARFMRKDK